MTVHLQLSAQLALSLVLEIQQWEKKIHEYLTLVKFSFNLEGKRNKQKLGKI